MFHAPTSENKQSDAPTRTRTSPERSHEVHPHPCAALGPVDKRAAILQHSLGNQAVLRMLDQRAKSLKASEPGWHKTNTVAARPNSSPAQARLPAPPGVLQAKLVVGSANDPLEQEADRVADQVMRMPDPEFAVTSADPRISRKCTTCEAEEKRKLQMKPGGTPDAAGREPPPIVHEVLRSPGEPLDAATRAFFEPRFSADFSEVRLHTDARAADTAMAVGALAYTVGTHIVLGPGQFPLQNGTGGILLAHELAHVVQQGEAVQAPSADAAILQRVHIPLMQRATKKGCIAPSFVVDKAIASAFGTLAETLVEADYLAQMGGVPFADVFLDNPFGPMSYVAFLASHHPSLNVSLLAAQISLSGGILVPDILDTRGALEFYDVKPDSPDGRFAGRGKLAALDAFMAFNTLPYNRGVSYTPTPSLPIPLAGAALTAAITAIAGPATAVPALACGFPVVTLAPKRTASGLLLYQICVEADLDCYLKVLALEALIAAIIAAAIATSGGSLPETVPELVPALAPLFGVATPELSTSANETEPA